MPRFCGIFGCTSKETKTKKSFFRLPAARKIVDPELTRLRRLKWLAAIRREDLTELKMKYLWICEDHFISGKPSDYRDINNSDWVPSVKMGYERDNSNDHMSENFTGILEEDDCLSEKDKHKNVLFTGLMSTCCPESIIAQELMMDNSLDSEGFLRKENLTKMTNKENRNTNSIILQKKTAIKEDFTYKYLLKNLSFIQKPNYFWGISSHSNIIICARWNEDYTCAKKVLINSSLDVKAFLKELEINLSKLMTITCINDLSDLLVKMESYDVT